MAIYKLGDKRYEPGSVNKYTLSRAKVPPVNAPEVYYVVDENSTLDLVEYNPQFKYNFVYFNGEESTYSPVSEVLPKPIYNLYTSDNLSIGNQFAQLYYNAVSISIDIPSPSRNEGEKVYKINLLVRYSAESNWFLIDTFNVEETLSLTYRFNGKSKLIPVDQGSVNRSFDWVPDRVNDLVVKNNKVFDAGVVEGKSLSFGEGAEVSILQEENTTNLGINTANSVPLYYTISAPQKYLQSSIANYSFPILSASSESDRAKLKSMYGGFYTDDIDGDYVYVRGYQTSLNGLGWKYIYDGSAWKWIKSDELFPMKLTMKISNIDSVNILNMGFLVRLITQYYAPVNSSDGNRDSKLSIPFNVYWNRDISASNDSNLDSLKTDITESGNRFIDDITTYLEDFYSIDDIKAFFSIVSTGIDIEVVNTFIGTRDLYCTVHYGYRLVHTIQSTDRGDNPTIYPYMYCGSSIKEENYIENRGAVYLEGQTDTPAYEEEFFYNESITEYGSIEEYSSPPDILTVLNSNFGAINMFKHGVNNQFGLRYYDDYGKYYFDYADDNMSIIPTNLTISDESIGTSIMKYEINHIPPEWAKYYTFTYAYREHNFEYYYVPVSSNNIENSSISSLYYDNVFYGYDDNLVNAKIYSAWIGNDIDSLNSPLWDFQKGDRVRIAAIRLNEADPYWENFTGDDYFKYDFSLSSLKEKSFDDPTSTSDPKTFTVIEFYSSELSEATFESITNSTDNIIAVLFELYRPQQDTDNVKYYEFYDKIPIDPDGYHEGGYDITGTNRPQAFRQGRGDVPARGYLHGGTVWGRFKLTSKVPDVQDLSSSETYTDLPYMVAESRTISDHILSWDNNFSKPGLERNEYSEGAKEYPIVRWSEPYIKNLNINGLSTVYPDAYEYLDAKYGDINAVESFGGTLVVFQDRKITSFYADKRQIYNADGSSSVVTSQDVLSTPNPRVEDYGTTFKMSLEKNNRRIYFFDIYNKAMCMYAANGVHNIASGNDTQSQEYPLKMGRYFKDKSNALLSSGLENVKVISTYSEMEGILFVTFIDSKNSTNNETIGFHEATGKWISFYSFTPEMYGRYAEVYASFKDGRIYIHNRDTGKLYGNPYESSVDIVVNNDANRKKLFDYLRVHSNKAMDTELTIDDTDKYHPYGMYSKIPEALYEMYEGQYESDVLSNMYDTNGNPTMQNLYDGDRMRGYAVRIKLTGEDIELFGIDIGMTYS